MVRDDMGPNDVASLHRNFLLNGDYDVEIVLSVEVNDSGGLAPATSYMSPITAATSFLFNANATLSESRDHNFTENIQLSMRNIFIDWKTNIDHHDCPSADTNLAGTLGIKDFVAMAALTSDLDTSQKLSAKGIFGGSIQFLVTKNLSAIGPTWNLTHFKGPGPLASISQVDTDKLTFAFAEGPNAGKKMQYSKATNPAAHYYLQQLLTSQINSQLTVLQNSLHP